MLKRLNEVNNVPVLSVFDEEFKTFGRVVSGYDFKEMISYMESETSIPEQGNIYVPKEEGLQNCAVMEAVSDTLYGGKKVQAGYCNGRNTTYNGFEYHKGSEINVAVTDFMLVLAHVWDIKDNTINAESATVFFVEKGTAIEMYQTTLHLSPCRVCDEGFKAVVILPDGTNTPLDKKEVNDDPESKLLLLKNKWVLAHPEREALIKQGAHPGMLGENKELHY